jgi:hypothetical protein
MKNINEGRTDEEQEKQCDGQENKGEENEQKMRGRRKRRRE